MNGQMEQWQWLTSAKPAIAAGVLVLLWLIESVAPMVAERRRRISHDLANVLLGVINATVAGVLFGAAMLLVTEWARQQPFGLLHWLAPRASAWVLWPVGLVLFDAWMYGWHVLNHKVPLLWRFHAVHHADREMDASSAMRFHTGEIILSGSARLAVLCATGEVVDRIVQGRG